MESNILRGKRMVIGIISVMLGVSFLSISFYIFSVGFQDIFSQVVRFIFSCLLCYYMYKGQKWARIIIIVLSMIAALTSLLFTLNSINLSVGIVLFLYFIIYGIISVLLISSKSIKSYMEFKRA